jgi:hypothetical protein
MLRRFAFTAAASLAVLGAAPALTHADTGADAPGRPPALAAADRLTITVTGAGTGADGTYRLECNPDGGTHPNASAACERLRQLAAQGQQPFAATPRRSMCTMIYGGPATAHVTGTWQGRTIDAGFKRTDGCEVGRWNALVPVLPAVGV